MHFNKQSNYRDLKLVARSSALVGLIICGIIPFKLIIIITMARIEAISIFELIPFWETAQMISLAYMSTYFVFLLLLLSWIFFSYSNLLNNQAGRANLRECGRRFHRWPWRNHRRTFLVVSKDVLLQSSVLNPVTHWARKPHWAESGRGFVKRNPLFFAIAGFFIPLWFFYHPYFIMTKLWAGSSDVTTRQTARLVSLLWLLSNPLLGFFPMIGYQIIMWLRWGHFYIPQIWPPAPDALSSLIFIPYTCWLIFRINKMQKAKFQNASKPDSYLKL